MVSLIRNLTELKYAGRFLLPAFLLRLPYNQKNPNVKFYYKIYP